MHVPARALITNQTTTLRAHRLPPPASAAFAGLAVRASKLALHCDWLLFGGMTWRHCRHLRLR